MQKEKLDYINKGLHTQKCQTDESVWRYTWPLGSTIHDLDTGKLLAVIIPNYYVQN